MPKKKQPKLEIYEGGDTLFYWHLVAANGKIIADSGEGYVTERNARRAWKTTVHIIHEMHNSY